MSPWPGSPKSASSPPINPPSTRFPFTLNESSSMSDVADAMRTAFNGLTVHEQAFANLPSQIATQATAAATTVIQENESIGVSGVSSFNTLAGAIIYFPGMGTVVDELGEASVTVTQGEAGAKIIVGDSSAVSINFDSGITAPWFCVIDNDSTSTATLVANVGIMNGAQHVYPGGFGLVFYDGANWWAGSTPVASPPGLVLIQTIVLSAPATSITFSAIPQTFTNLKLVGNFDTVSGALLTANFNGDVTVGDYGYGFFYQDNGTPGAIQSNSAGGMGIGASFGAVVVDIACYKSASAIPGVAISGTFAAVRLGSLSVTGSSGGVWNGTDVTSIELTDSGGASFVAGSSFSLYGLP